MTAPKSGNEYLTIDGMPTIYQISDFWRWGFSDLLNNTLRGVYAEFIVAAALGVDLSVGREDWTAWDLTYQNIHIEVKSGSYLQAWEQQKLSNIAFSIRPTRAWDASTGYDDLIRRQSDVYVFCVFTPTDRENANPLELNGWTFYVVPTPQLDAEYGAQKTVSLSSLQKLGPISATFDNLRDAVLEAVRRT